MNQRVLGITAIACSPFLFIDFLINGSDQNTSWTVGVFDMIYMTGWMCSIIALLQIKATGSSKLGKAVLVLQMMFLIVAQLSNFFSIFNISTSTAWSAISDLFWSLSNLCMIITGIAVIKNKVLNGWKRFVPLAMGLWLPVTGVMMNIFDPAIILSFFSGPYSAVTWSFAGVAIYNTASPEETNSNKIHHGIKSKLHSVYERLIILITKTPKPL